jgi:hypothetical protein
MPIGNRSNTLIVMVSPKFWVELMLPGESADLFPHRGDARIVGGEVDGKYEGPAQFGEQEFVQGQPHACLGPVSIRRQQVTPRAADQVAG